MDLDLGFGAWNFDEVLALVVPQSFTEEAQSYTEMNFNYKE
jgi:hypothetical protein